MYQLRTSHAVTAVALVALLTTVSPSGHGQHALGAGGGFGESSSDCPHVGTSWEDPQVVFVGPDSCSEADILDLAIGEDQQGNAVNFSSPTCVSLIKVKPERMARVAKTGWRTVNPLPEPYLQRTFSCGGFPTTPYCYENGSGTPTADAVDSWSEESCEGLIGGNSQ